MEDRFNLEGSAVLSIDTELYASDASSFITGQHLVIDGGQIC